MKKKKEKRFDWVGKIRGKGTCDTIGGGGGGGDMATYQVSYLVDWSAFLLFLWVVTFETIFSTLFFVKICKSPISI